MSMHPGLFTFEPEKWLGLDASHTPEKLHSLKKPENYFEIPNIGMSGEDVRDAIVEGSMDEIQLFPPFEVTYTVPAPYAEKEELDLKTTIRQALGKRGKGALSEKPLGG